LNKNNKNKYDEFPDKNFDNENFCYEVIFNGPVEQHGKAYYFLAKIYRQQEHYNKAEDNLFKAIEFGYNRQLCFDDIDAIYAEI